MHFVVWLADGLRAEIQVRTLLQHAHSLLDNDRIYKSPHPLPPPLLRYASRLSFILH